MLEKNGQAVLIKRDNRLSAVHRTLWDELCARVETSLEQYHAEFPLKPGPNREELKNRGARSLEPVLYHALLEGLEQEGRLAMEGASVKKADHSIRFSDAEEEIKNQIEALLQETDFAKIPDSDALAQRLRTDKKQIDAMLKALQDLGRVIPLEGGLVLHKHTVEQVQVQLGEALKQNGQIKVAEFRDLIGSNRRYALALLSHFDAQGFTQRRDDVRVLLD